MHTNVKFDPLAECPRWERFLSEVFAGDQELIDFIHRAVGYSLTGDTSEQCFFGCEGAGANGKSTFLEALRQVLGDYAANTPFSTLEWKGRSAIPNDVAALAGKRFIAALETNESVQLNEARIKQLTGSDPVTARYLYREHFTFTMEGKIWLAFNHRPVVRDDSDAYWRRVRPIPFPQQFKGKRADKHLPSKLKEEAPGILAWAVRGCLAWQQHGLGELPEAVQEATDAYREESDPISEFIKERCRVDPDAQTTAAALWKAYTEWCNENGCSQLDRKGFATRLKERGFKQDRIGHDRTRGWQGLCCNSEKDTLVDEADVRTPADATSHSSPNKDLV
jgi:putative DNA primase/helicase